MSIDNRNQDKFSNASRIARFQELIRVKTISYNDPEKIDYAAFKQFEATLEKLYPSIHAACQKTHHGRTGILFHLKGREAGAPIVLMSHYDVVPVNEELWTVPAFDALIKEDAIWGRGTLDTKGTLFAVMESVEEKLEQGFVPKNDIYLSFSGDEEISGDSAPSIVRYLKSIGIEPALVLDEGGAVVEDVFPGLKKPCALIGVGEKGYLDISITLEGQGGHSSAPPAQTLVTRLAKVLIQLEKNPLQAHFTPPVSDMFKTLGKESDGVYKFIFKHLNIFAPVLKWYFTKQGGEMNAMIRTTIAPTKMTGSKAFNVMPPVASIGLNLRILGTDKIDDVIAHIKKVSGEPDLIVEVHERREASPDSPSDSLGFNNVKNAIEAIWPNAVVSPYLMLAGSDSRHFCEVSKNVLRFSAMALSKTERGLIHSNDERITIKGLLEAVDFYKALLKHY